MIYFKKHLITNFPSNCHNRGVGLKWEKVKMNTGLWKHLPFWQPVKNRLIPGLLKHFGKRGVKRKIWWRERPSIVRSIDASGRQLLFTFLSWLTLISLTCSKDWIAELVLQSSAQFLIWFKTVTVYQIRLYTRVFFRVTSLWSPTRKPQYRLHKFLNQTWF